MKNLNTDHIFREFSLTASELGFADVAQEGTQLFGTGEGSAGNCPVQSNELFILSAGPCLNHQVEVLYKTRFSHKLFKALLSL